MKRDEIVCGFSLSSGVTTPHYMYAHWQTQDELYMHTHHTRVILYKLITYIKHHCHIKTLCSYLMTETVEKRISFSPGPEKVTNCWGIQSIDPKNSLNLDSIRNHCARVKYRSSLNWWLDGPIASMPYVRAVLYPRGEAKRVSAPSIENDGYGINLIHIFI